MYLSGSMRRYVIDMNKHETIDYDWDNIEFVNMQISYNGNITLKNDFAKVDDVIKSLNQKLLEGVENQIIIDAINDYKPSSLIAELRFILAKYRNLDFRVLLLALESFQAFINKHKLMEIRNYLPNFEACLAYINNNLETIDQIDLEIIFQLLNDQKPYNLDNLNDAKKQKFGIITDEISDYKIKQTIKLGQFVAPSRLKKISAFFNDQEFAKKVAPIYLLANSDDDALNFLKNYLISNDINTAAIDAGISRSLVKLTNKRM